MKNLIRFVNGRLDPDLRYAINSSNIESELGWKRKYDFDDGIMKTINWYKDSFK